MRVGNILCSKINGKYYMIVGYLNLSFSTNFLLQFIKESKNFNDFVEYYTSNIWSMTYAGIELEDKNKIKEVIAKKSKLVLLNDVDMYELVGNHNNIVELTNYITKQRLLGLQTELYTEPELMTKLSGLYEKYLRELIEHFCATREHIRVKSQLQNCGVYLYVLEKNIRVLLKNLDKYAVLGKVECYKAILDIVEKVRDIKYSYTSYELVDYYPMTTVIGIEDVLMTFPKLKWIRNVDIKHLYLLDGELDKIISNNE